MINKISAAFYFDTRHTKKEGRHPIKLRVIYLREKKLYATGYDATPYEWEIIISKHAWFFF